MALEKYDRFVVDTIEDVLRRKRHWLAVIQRDANATLVKTLLPYPYKVIYGELSKNSLRRNLFLCRSTFSTSILVRWILLFVFELGESMGRRLGRKTKDRLSLRPIAPDLHQKNVKLNSFKTPSRVLFTLRPLTNRDMATSRLDRI